MHTNVLMHITFAHGWCVTEAVFFLWLGFVDKALLWIYSNECDRAPTGGPLKRMLLDKYLETRVSPTVGFGPEIWPSKAPASWGALLGHISASNQGPSFPALLSRIS